MKRSCCGVRHVCLLYLYLSLDLQPWTVPRREGEEVADMLGTVPLLEMGLSLWDLSPTPSLCSGDGCKRHGRTWALSTTSIPERWDLPIPMEQPAASAKHDAGSNLCCLQLVCFGLSLHKVLGTFSFSCYTHGADICPSRDRA